MPPLLSPGLLQEIESAYEQIKSLPFPVHVSDVDGNFLFANAAARQLFRIPEEAPFNILSCYEDQEERFHLLRQVEHVAQGVWVKDLTARLNIGGEQYKVRFASQPYFENGRLAAILNIADSMSIVEWFAEFENELELGLFEIDKDFVIVDCNAALVGMMGFDAPKELIDRPVGDFLWDSSDIQELFDEILEKKFLRKRQVKLRRRDDAMVIVEMSCSAISWEEGRIARVKGIVRDITFEIIQQVNPLGLFLVTAKPNGEEIFSRVNDTFAQLHGYNSARDILGMPANRFQARSKDNYLDALNKAYEKGEPLLDYFMEIIDRQDKKHNVVVNARYVYGPEEKIRVGAVYDLTHHVGKHRHTLETNFSAVLHTYIATIDGLRSTLAMLIKAHGQDLLKPEGQVDRRRAAAEIERRKQRLSGLLEQLANVSQERQIEESKLAPVQKYWRNLHAAHESEKSNASWLRLNLLEIRKHLDGLRNLNLPRELLKSIRGESEEILRLSSMISISISVDELNERIHDFYYFRDYLRRGDTEKQDLKPLNLVTLLNNSIQFLEEFASLNGVTIKQQFNPRDVVMVAGSETVLNRALHSLLHNAIKYSWSKSQERRPWVEIKVEKKTDTVELTIENWGVPIRREELENDLIFQFGKRGKESDDRGRAGTGIGLFDARDIIQRHGGALKITSEPTFGNMPEVYTNPFITRATISLPLHKNV